MINTKNKNKNKKVNYNILKTLKNGKRQIMGTLWLQSRGERTMARSKVLSGVRNGETWEQRKSFSAASGAEKIRYKALIE